MLPQLERLRIQGPGAEDHSVSLLTAKCPALVHLALHSTWIDELYIFTHLKTQPLTLKSLSLSVEHGLVVVRDEQSILERFTQLRSLHLGDKCYNNAIHSTLLKLPLLVEIHLGQGLFEPDDFLPLVSGSTRLLFLKTITLDFEPGRTGKKISPPSKQEVDATRELERCPIEMIDWRLPKIGEVTFQVSGLKRLIEVAKGTGVTVRGRILSALQSVDDYRLESHNRAILFTYNYHTLDHLRKARPDAARDGVALPPLDLDSLDFT